MTFSFHLFMPNKVWLALAVKAHIYIVVGNLELLIFAEDIIIVTGGILNAEWNNLNSYVTSVEVNDQSGEMRTCPAIDNYPIKTIQHSVANSYSSVVVCGGYTANPIFADGVQDACWMLPAGSVKWKAFPSMKQARHIHASLQIEEGTFLMTGKYSVNLCIFVFYCFCSVRHKIYWKVKLFEMLVCICLTKMAVDSREIQLLP